MEIKKTDKKDKTKIENKNNKKVEEIVKEDVIETTQKESVEKTKQQLAVELNSRTDEVLVELLNIGTARTVYINKFDDTYFDIEPGERETVTLKQLKEIVNKSKKFFTGGSLILTEVYNDDYDLADILKFLRLDRIKMADYDELEELIVDEDDSNFESFLKGKENTFVKQVAGKAVFLNYDESSDFELSRTKENILCDLLGLDQLIY